MTKKDYQLYGTKVLNLKTQEIGLQICLWENKFADKIVDFATCVDKTHTIKPLQQGKNPILNSQQEKNKISQLVENSLNDKITVSTNKVVEHSAYADREIATTVTKGSNDNI